jgi:RNA polymerase sigma-70 factor (family 1)
MHLKAAPGFTEIESRKYDLNQFELLYKNLSNSLQRYADYYVRDLDAARSIVNDLFVQLWLKNEQPGNVKGYMYRSVKNGCLNYLAQQKRNPLYYLEQDELTFIADLNFSARDETDESDQLKFLQKVISLLPEKRQLVFRMYRLEGFSYAEIADLLQISVRTVEDHLAKSMQFIHAHSKHLVHKKLTEA